MGDSEEIEEPVESSEDAEAGPAPAPRQGMLNLKPMDDLERKVGLIAGGVGAVVVVGVWIPFWSSSAPVWLVLGWVIAGALAWAANRRNRFGTGIAAFLFAMSFPVPFAGFPWLGMGMWLWFRGKPSPEEVAERQRLRREAAAARRASRKGEPAPSASTTGRKTPPQSKRYTPPAGKR